MSHNRSCKGFIGNTAIKIALLSFITAAATAVVFHASSTSALTTAPQKINFQGRLSDASGNVVANGLYNMKFALYSAASGGTLKWSETRETTNRVQVTGGLFTVKLGDVAAFTDPTIFSGGALYFEITLANPATATCSTASCQTWESPMNRSELATSAYAFNAELLDGLDSTAFAAAAGSAGYIQNQAASQQATANFWMSGIGRADTALQAPLVDTATATTLSIGTTNATSISLNKDVTVATGKSLTLGGGNTGTRPASPGEGALYYDTDTDKLLSYANAKWQADRTDAVYVAASNSSQADKDIADYVGNGDTAAAGDGDQIQINDALIAAAGKQVVLLAGTYTADATILVPNNTTLAGVGVSTLIQLADIDVSDNLIENTDQVTGTGVVIRDLNLDGQKALNTVGSQGGIRMVGMGSGVGASAVSGAVIENVNVVSFSATGIRLESSDNNFIRGNTVKSTNAGIVLSAASYNTISDNSVHGSNANGIHLQSSSNNNNVTDNQVHAPVGNGINVQSTSNYNAVTGNQVTSATAYGIYSSTVGNAISGNSISASGIGIILFTGSSDNSVTGNSVKNSTDDGIYVYNSVRNTVSGNTILNTTDDGIAIDSESHNNTVNSNTIDTASGAGIVVIGIAGDEPTNNTVTGNSIINTGSSNWNYGIELGYAHKNTIANNRITDDSCSVTCYAISIRATSTTNYITNNTFNSTPGTSVIDNLGTGTVYSNQPLSENGGNMTNRLANSATAFQVQNASGVSLFTVDSTNGKTIFNTTNGTAGARVVEFAQGGTVQGYVSINGGSTSYNAFTGSHFAKIDSGSAEPYQLVSLTGNNAYRPGSPEPIYGVNKTAIANDPNVLGALLGISDGSQTYSEDNPYLVMAAGNGDVWVADNGSGNVRIGDQLLSSGDLAGYAQRDPGTYETSHVFAKAAQPVDWSTVTQTVDGVKVARVSVLFSFYDQNNAGRLLQGSNPTLSGDLGITGDLYISGSATMASINVTDGAVFGKLEVRGDAKIHGILTVSGAAHVGGIHINGHIDSAGKAPTVNVGVALGTGSAGAVLDGTDSAGTLTLTAGTSNVATGVLAHVKFADNYTGKYKVVISPSDANTAGLRLYVVKTGDGFDIVSNDILATQSTYELDYVVVGANGT